MATIQELCSKTYEEATPRLQKSKSKPRELAEMDEVKEENERLKLVLSNMMKDYKTLQHHIDNMSSSSSDHQQQEENKSDDKDAASHKELDDLVILSLGRSSSLEAKNKDQLHLINKQDHEDHDNLNRGLALRLDSRSYEYSGDHNATEIVSRNQSPGKIEEEAVLNDRERHPSKDLKTSRSGDDENYLQQNPTKKARVSVRAICNGPTMNDGCQWRKYGQKKAKGNPCPRAYYRCTMSPSCPVRKHVQRCPENMSILVTTYEGTHNHPLPPSATAMASTTSAAVSMLKSTSSTSTSQPSFSFPSTTSANINHNPFYVPNTTISTFQSHPTITLDLTTPSASSRFNKYSSTFFPAPQPMTYSSAACLNFSAPSSSSSSFEHWRSRNISSSSILAYSGSQLTLPSYNTPFYQPYNYNVPNKNTYDHTHQPQLSTEKIAAATKEITSNPSFQSAVAAAISSIVGRDGGLAEGIESHLGAAFATRLLNRTSTVVPSISKQSENLKFELSPLASHKGPLAGSTEKGEYKKY